MKNRYGRGYCINMGAWTVCRFKGGVGVLDKKEEGDVIEGG